MQISPPSFADLPQEMQLATLQFLPVKDLAIAALVCKQWQKLAEDPLIWKKHFQRQWKKWTSSAPSKGVNWKSIYKKKHMVRQKAKASQQRLNQYNYQHIAYKLPAFAARDALEFKLEKKTVWIKTTPHHAQLYAFTDHSCQLVFDNLTDEQAPLLHYHAGHLIQLTQKGALYRWPMQAKAPEQPLAKIGAFEEAYFAEHLLFLVLKRRQCLALYDVRTGGRLDTLATFSSAIRLLECRGQQALVQCMDGTLYFLPALANGHVSPLYLEGSAGTAPLVKKLVQWDARQIVMLSDDGTICTCKVWDASSGQLLSEVALDGLHRLKHLPRPSITAACYDQDQLAVGLSNGNLNFYTLPTGQLQATYPLYPYPIGFIHFEPDHCVTAGQKFGTIRFFDRSSRPRNMGRLVSLRPSEVDLIDGIQPFIGLHFDERRGACCTQDGWLDRWDFAKAASTSLVLPP